MILRYSSKLDKCSTCENVQVILTVVGYRRASRLFFACSAWHMFARGHLADHKYLKDEECEARSQFSHRHC
jgi:hypothetical protein